ncbi:FAD-dependent thymidylate synthase [Pectobacterium versatile]|uniref:Flavin-dependent thymidylate synthase n=1 Tax=Pectobacterium versatile TaxID=2488639 RepID=A0A855MF74_9GAMM|nr:FAD-dependent thymidylate synthase [Pectobacterium versatile]MBN3236762.1 FAD-dependent thymidylate synthase [Pectobacterium versatile]MBQ4791870.1 FAD-dependent thymidylate synthase [Pectobacterium versatile]MBQ4793488.1 FAD-dependent thymidylate synthase [Pectobacterium versatile]POY49219.1 Flavin-dependent thymidylate synthase [Pectobacterium versatile]QPK15060.1 FAD-dependent thymidylate synthase [Pectobacterium versatile]
MIKIAELSIRCISHPNFKQDVFTDFLNENGLTWIQKGVATGAEHLVEASGRLCYMSFGELNQSPKNSAQYIMNLIEQGHESVLEHLNWTFLITGVSRAFTHQLVRHRAGFSYSQLSQQYHDESDAEFVVPVEVKNNPELFDAWKKHIEACLEFYKTSLLDINSNQKMDNFSKKENMRALRSASRSILPNATETKIIVTANARGIRHFLKMRGSLDGDYEMRMVSEKIYNIVRCDAPALFQDFEVLNENTCNAKVVKFK